MESISTEEKKLDGNHGHYRPIELVTLQGHQELVVQSLFLGLFIFLRKRSFFSLQQIKIGDLLSKEAFLLLFISSQIW